MNTENGKYKQGWQRTNDERDFCRDKRDEEKVDPDLSAKKERKTIQNFRDLKIWQLGKEIVVETYKVTRSLPGEELYGLTTQMRRAAISIPSNISEGHSRRATRDYQRFLKIAAGSCAELETQVEVAVELGFFKADSCKSLMEKIAYETCMLRKLISKLSENYIRHPSSNIQNIARTPSPAQA